MTRSLADGAADPFCAEPAAPHAERLDDRQDLPGEASFLPPPADLEPDPGEVHLGGAWQQLALDVAVSAAKSMEVAARGARVWNAAVFAYAWTMVEDACVAHRSRLSCRSLAGLLRLERDLAPHAVAELAMRTAVLGRIGVQIMQDAASPLHQQAAQTLEDLCSTPPSQTS
jgi:hypothetical protein